jgi:hypothetical protein
LGVIDGYRKMGIEACLYGSIIKEYRRKGLKYAEASWTLENNDMVKERVLITVLLKLLVATSIKHYRIYEKTI